MLCLSSLYIQNGVLIFCMFKEIIDYRMFYFVQTSSSVFSGYCPHFLPVQEVVAEKGGWEYAQTFNGRVHIDELATDMVRRRRWVRPMTNIDPCKYAQIIMNFCRFCYLPPRNKFNQYSELMQSKISFLFIIISVLCNKTLS